MNVVLRGTTFILDLCLSKTRRGKIFMHIVFKMFSLQSAFSKCGRDRRNKHTLDYNGKIINTVEKLRHQRQAFSNRLFLLF